MEEVELVACDLARVVDGVGYRDDARFAVVGERRRGELRVSVRTDGDRARSRVFARLDGDGSRAFGKRFDGATALRRGQFHYCRIVDRPLVFGVLIGGFESGAEHRVLLIDV